MMRRAALLGVLALGLILPASAILQYARYELKANGVVQPGG
jgi:hypothetical protein